MNNQSRELNHARLKFLKRNPAKYDELMSRWRDFFNENDLSEDGKDDILVDEMGKHAVVDMWDAASGALATKAYWRALERAGIEEPIPDSVPGGLTPDWRRKYLAYEKQRLESKELDRYFLEELKKDATGIIDHLMSEGAGHREIVSIDITRPIETILAEVKNLVMGEKRNLPAARFKWLGMVDDLLAVWDAWTERGEPARQSFPAIAKKLKVPASTVKARWYKAYQLICGEPYGADPVKTREDRTDRALELCRKCTNPVCAKRHGGEEIGCPAYIKLAGRQYARERDHENFDILSDMHSLETYLEDDPK